MKNRSKYEIFADVLALCQKPMLRTRISQMCNLNMNQLMIYVRELKARGLLEEVNPGPENRTSFNRYLTTEKGREFLVTFEKLESVTA